jgi:hypothetical protein
MAVSASQAVQLGDGNALETLGFRLGRGGAHSARSIMLDDLEALLAGVSPEHAAVAAYRRAIEEENILGKRSGKTRILTTRHLIELYSLDPNVPIFNALLFFWAKDPSAHPVVALLCAYARDGVLRAGAPFVLRHDLGASVTRQSLEAYIAKGYPGRFSAATLRSVAQNINASLTRTGHLNGRVGKTRGRATATPGAAAYALFLGHLSGARGELLLETEYAKLLDCPAQAIIELAEEASRRGWMVFKRIGRVMEVRFPKLQKGNRA